MAIETASSDSSVAYNDISAPPWNRERALLESSWRRMRQGIRNHWENRAFYTAFPIGVVYVEPPCE